MVACKHVSAYKPDFLREPLQKLSFQCNVTVLEVWFPQMFMLDSIKKSYYAHAPSFNQIVSWKVATLLRHFIAYKEAGKKEERGSMRVYFLGIYYYFFSSYDDSY